MKKLMKEIKVNSKLVRIDRNNQCMLIKNYVSDQSINIKHQRDKNPHSLFDFSEQHPDEDILKGFNH